MKNNGGIKRDIFMNLLYHEQVFYDICHDKYMQAVLVELLCMPYNIFVMTNILADANLEGRVANLFHLLGQPGRLMILLVIGEFEACVCHLEAVLGFRQAYISQQLMVLREAGLVETRRDGRNIFYCLSDPRLLEVIRQTALLCGAEGFLNRFEKPVFVSHCPCPHCAEAAGVDPDTVKKIVC